MRPQDRNGEVRLTDEDLTEHFRDHASIIYLVALGILQDLDQAEDAVGEVFLRLALSREPVNASKGYFTTAARNEAFHILRRSQRSAKFATAFRAMQEDHDPGPENEIARSEQRRILRQLIRRLPGRCRQVHEMIVEGFTQAEIAHRLRISPDAVQKQASRGRRLLMKMSAQLGIAPSHGLSPKVDGGG